MWLAKELEHWREFYLLVGTAGATLLALMFVAVSLGVGYLTEERQAATRIFMSPVIIHFTSVFFVSAIAMVPSHQAVFFAALIALTALTGAVVGCVITWRVVKSDMTSYMQDRFGYGVLPVLSYIGMLAAAVLIFVHNEIALDVLAGALLLLTMVNIRNAWDLTVTMVQRHHE